MKAQVTATIDELRGYRNYKLDLIDGGKIDIDMEIISYILENSDHNLAQILANSDDDDDITISKNEVTRSNRKKKANDLQNLYKRLSRK